MLLSQWVENNPEANAQKVVRSTRSNEGSVCVCVWGDETDGRAGFEKMGRLFVKG